MALESVSKEIMGVTLKDIARELGVNQATVSLVLNAHPTAGKFTSATRKRICDAASRLGYQPNAAARALEMRRTNCLALVIPDYVEGQWKNSFYATLLNGINRICQKRNYSVLTYCCNMDNVEEFVFPYGIAGGGVDGILLCGYAKAEILERFDRLDIPCARLGISVDKAEHGIRAVFSPDIVRGLVQAVEYLVRHNHTNIVLMNSGVQASHTIADMLNGRLATLSHPTAVRYIFTPDGRCDAGAAKDFMAEYFSLPESERPSALITNPQTCMGVIKEMNRYNLRSPDHMSLISLYDYDIFDYITPGITSLTYDNEAIAAFAADRLIDKLTEKSKAEAFVSKDDFPVTLNIRNSCSTL